MQLLEPLALGPRQAPNRVMFGPHVTNLGDDDRRFTNRHVAYYERRARGGCGTIVVEGASVHASDWPYERAPLAAVAERGWSDIADACHRHGTLVVASLDHAGGQGSSAYNQLPLWAPSPVPEVTSREVPKCMEDDDIEAVVAGFESAARARRGGRLRRGRDQRRPAQPRPPVPVRADEPAPGSLGAGAHAVRPRGHLRRARRRRRWPDRGAAPVL